MRAAIRLVLAALMLGAAWAEDLVPADLAGLPPVPNPYGFDLRLALRTHLEDNFAQHDVAHLSGRELVARYRALTRPEPPDAVAPPPADRRPSEAVSAEHARRLNILLQLEREYGERPAADTSTDELRARLDALVQAARERAQPSAPREVAQPVSTLPVDPNAPAAQPADPAVTELDLATLTDATAVLGGVVIAFDRGAGDRLAGVCFSDDLGIHFATVMRRFAQAMQRSEPARTGLLLLGHGNGVDIGVGGAHPVNLTSHLRRNVAAYHALLGVERIDCVVILSCSRKADAQFTAFRDGLGYYPTWRVSAWEHTLQTLASGLAATELALSQPPGTDFRAAVFHGKEADVASLAEAGQRTSTQYLQVDVVGTEMVFSPARRR